MKRSRRSRREDVCRKMWLEQAGKWDGTAHVFNPNERKYELADRYKSQLAEPMMFWFDQLRASERRRIANSIDGD